MPTVIELHHLRRRTWLTGSMALALAALSASARTATTASPNRRLALLTETFAPYVSLPFDDAAAGHYARIRHELEIGGRVIGPNDLLSAAICLANDCTLATGNVAEFQRVSGLRVEDWTIAA